MRRSMLSMAYGMRTGTQGHLNRTCTAARGVCGTNVFFIERRGFPYLQGAIRLTLHRVSRVRTLCSYLLSALYRSELN